MRVPWIVLVAMVSVDAEASWVVTVLDKQTREESRFVLSEDGFVVPRLRTFRWACVVSAVRPPVEKNDGHLRILTCENGAAFVTAPSIAAYEAPHLGRDGELSIGAVGKAGYFDQLHIRLFWEP